MLSSICSPDHAVALPELWHNDDDDKDRRSAFPFTRSRSASAQDRSCAEMQAAVCGCQPSVSAYGSVYGTA